MKSARFLKFLGNDPKVLAFGNFLEMTQNTRFRKFLGNDPKSARFRKFLGNDTSSSQLPASECASDLWAPNTKSVDGPRDPSYDDEFFSCP